METEVSNVGGAFLEKFKLYETPLEFYMVGRDESKTHWRVLKIDRSESAQLNIQEDPAVYSESERDDLLKVIDEENITIGGLNFVTVCYGIVGFVKFLGPYYMVLITGRSHIGTIYGHAIYTITKSKMIALPSSTVWTNISDSKNENRYRKLFCSVDITKDFFFSYSYSIMQSLQKNLYGTKMGQVSYKTMFIWNEFLIRGIRDRLKNINWTVALVYGFFKQATYAIHGKEIDVTLVCRRSRHYAGTRYLKRGVNEKGRVANEVETEQIVSENIHHGYISRITSVVQHRGSIPLFWSQDTSRLDIKPDIILMKDQNFEATRLHFEGLAKRYGSPVIVLNLIKTHEKKPRESILGAEFANAIQIINKDLPEDDQIRFIHWDLAKQSNRKSTQILQILGKIAAVALRQTGFFYSHQVTEASSLEHGGAFGSGPYDADISPYSCSAKLQTGVLRTNCIDCLDRTNVAQYAYGLAALGHQLHALDLIDVPKIDLDEPIADELMSLYGTMGNVLALQYGGSPAHNKIFSDIRGQWKAATQSQELLISIQRYYSNAYMDTEKQYAINLFLGYYQPQQGKPALWELNSDQNCNIGSRENTSADEKTRPSVKRSLSDGSISCDSNALVPAFEKINTLELGMVNGQKDPDLPDLILQDLKDHDLSDAGSEIATCETDASETRDTPTVAGHPVDGERRLVGTSSSNFIDIEWLSSYNDSLEEDSYQSLLDSPLEGRSSENITITPGSSTPRENRAHNRKKRDGSFEYSNFFKNWVLDGGALSYHEPDSS